LKGFWGEEIKKASQFWEAFGGLFLTFHCNLIKIELNFLFFAEGDFLAKKLFKFSKVNYLLMFIRLFLD
jgi:hypothetical protein